MMKQDTDIDILSNENKVDYEKLAHYIDMWISIDIKTDQGSKMIRSSFRKCTK